MTRAPPLPSIPTAVLDDSIFGQVPELQVPVGFPGAHHRDVSAETLHAGDVVPKSEWTRTRVMST